MSFFLVSNRFQGMVIFWNNLLKVVGLCSLQERNKATKPASIKSTIAFAIGYL